MRPVSDYVLFLIVTLWIHPPDVLVLLDGTVQDESGKQSTGINSCFGCVGSATDTLLLGLLCVRLVRIAFA